MPKKKPKSKEEEQKVLVVVDEFKRRNDKKVAGGALALLFQRLGFRGSGTMAASVSSFGSDLVASKVGFTVLLLAGYSAAIGFGVIGNLSRGPAELKVFLPVVAGLFEPDEVGETLHQFHERLR